MKGHITAGAFESLKKKAFSFWVLHISGWLVFALMTVGLSYWGKWTDIPRFLPFLTPYLIGFLLCIPLRYFYRGIRFHKFRLKYSILTGISASFVAANIWLWSDLAIRLFVNQPPYARPRFTIGQIYLTNMYRRGIPLLAWTFLYLGIKIWREWKEQEKRTKKATALAQTAQLQMLRYQVNPHFLFNAMNSLRALIDEDERKAGELVTELSEFLRYSLESKDFADVPLRHEIEAIQHYFAIQKKRYEDKLEVTYDIDPQAAEYPVLSFLIHPLVENAVKYGMRTSPLPLAVELKAKRKDGALVVEVSNTGSWVEPDEKQNPAVFGTGTGLENVRRRLKNAYPSRHRLDVVEKDGWVHLQLEIRKPQGT